MTKALGRLGIELRRAASMAEAAVNFVSDDLRQVLARRGGAKRAHDFLKEAVVLFSPMEGEPKRYDVDCLDRSELSSYDYSVGPFVKLAEALDDRTSFRRFCGFAADEPSR